ncbi:asparagine synthase (glutamine-hydrolyzing) [bacterium K02(2017)]|nr:asparagine synthase (glutamine-hydrolyzing) [bacterium K02(2017)]
MCGIVGGNIPLKKVLPMAQAIKHRGPDDHGDYQDEHISLAHVRLSIIDLSSRAHQPMSYDGLVLIYNGELFNYLQIKSELSALGYQFDSESDTEVVLKAYHAYGKKCLDRFNGDFSFCIYEKRAKKIFACRDRMGNKPFYYYHKNNLFVFASELKAFKSVFSLSFDQQSLGDAILFSINDHQKNTIYQNIYNLLPGHWLEYDLSLNSLKLNRYWDAEIPEDDVVFDQNKFNQKLDEFEFLLKDAVRLRLIGDVPVGCMLSGGLDSSIIASMIHENKSDVTYFHSSYPEFPEIDEYQYVAMLQQQWGLKLNRINPDFNSFKLDYSKLSSVQSDIFRSYSIYSQYAVYQKAYSLVKVMLSGQGADELFGGYQQHIAKFLADDPQNLVERKNVYNEDVINADIMYMNKYKLGNVEKKKTLIKENQKALELIHESLPNYKPDWDLLLDKFESNVSICLKNDTLKYSLPQLLRYEDRNAMNFGVENRTPFTDYRVIEFVLSLPKKYKFKNGLSKYFLRELGKRRLPKTVAERLDKKGFEAPDKQWLKKMGVNCSMGLVALRLDLFKQLKQSLAS